MDYHHSYEFRRCCNKLSKGEYYTGQHRCIDRENLKQQTLYEPAQYSRLKPPR